MSWLNNNFNKEVKPFGRLVAAHSRAGERVYFFDLDGSISFIPAELVDAEYTLENCATAPNSPPNLTE